MELKVTKEFVEHADAVAKRIFENPNTNRRRDYDTVRKDQDRLLIEYSYISDPDNPASPWESDGELHDHLIDYVVDETWYDVKLMNQGVKTVTVTNWDWHGQHKDVDAIYDVYMKEEWPDRILKEGDVVTVRPIHKQPARDCKMKNGKYPPGSIYYWI